ncbi:hypothetical protein CTAYLR_000858 [Chrysophaeum taylorii]|uniref:Glucose-6-phosphate isomerase n=1 Tax=Chrysophaeum taylorii TaxID=2483200 RepID=A0AAD7UP67_9STRA|nr:hypothetical protein CTAYLR_000858 [Chrysophaeum taylorii]
MMMTVGVLIWVVGVASGLRERPEWRALEAHAEEMKATHLRELVEDEERCARLFLEGPCGLVVDYARQKVTTRTMELLFGLAKSCEVMAKRDRMMRGERINTSEDRAVLHAALRSSRDSRVEAVVEKILKFAEGVRSGDLRTAAGDAFAAVLVVGIGGSQLGPEFVVRALEDARLETRFLGNVDAFEVATRGLDPRRTLVVVSSKSFTTTETMRNAERAKAWLGGGDVSDRVVGCSASREKVEAFGASRLFEFWDWVGGRFSATASPGLLPLALAAGADAARKFLDGAAAVDAHFAEAPLERNVPVVLALLGVWNKNFLDLCCRAVVPYAARLARFPAHVQQLEMESNGKSVGANDHRQLDVPAGEIVFGEPGTDAQHSFFQFLHAASPVPVDFVGFLRGTDAAAHDDLSANLFAQPDALAIGTPEDGTLPPYKRFAGDRPSLTILFPRLEPRSARCPFRDNNFPTNHPRLGRSSRFTNIARRSRGAWLWGINSWDQMGVELGKTLAATIRAHIQAAKSSSTTDGVVAQPAPAMMNPSTRRLLDIYARANRDDRGGSSLSSS